MVTEVRRPGALTLGDQDGVSAPNFAPVTAIVGAGSQWADDTDATHAVIGAARIGPSAAFDVAWGTVEAITFNPDWVTNLVVRVRAKVNTVPGAPGPSLFLGVRTLFAPGAYDTLASWDATTPGFEFDTITDLVYDYQADSDGSSLVPVTQQFVEAREVAAHPTLLPESGSDFNVYLTTVYEVTLEFTWSEALPAPEGLYLYDEGGQVLRPFNHIDNISTSP